MRKPTKHNLLSRLKASSEKIKYSRYFFIIGYCLSLALKHTKLIFIKCRQRNSLYISIQTHVCVLILLFTEVRVQQIVALVINVKLFQFKLWLCETERERETLSGSDARAVHICENITHIPRVPDFQIDECAKIKYHKL